MSYSTYEIDKLNARIAQLESQLEAALRDQRRYQWLRERDSESASDAAPFICIYAGSFIQWNGEAADAAIDAAMKDQAMTLAPWPEKADYYRPSMLFANNDPQARYAEAFYALALAKAWESRARLMHEAISFWMLSSSHKAAHERLLEVLEAVGEMPEGQASET